MVDVTETNRDPDIDAEVINAASVSADSGTVGTLDATDGLNAPVYATESDLPSATNQTEGAQAYVQSTGSFYVVVDN